MEDILLEREDLDFHLYSVLEDDALIRGMRHFLDGNQDITGDRPMDPTYQIPIARGEE